jgi:acetoin utilization protein AcuB
VRLTVLVPKGPGQLAKLTKSIFDLGGDIIAMVSFEGENSETGTITFKVAGVKRDDLVNAITPTVIKLLDVREMA